MAELTPQQIATLERLKAQRAAAAKTETKKTETKKNGDGTLFDDAGGALKTAAKESGKFIMDNVISGQSWKDIKNGDATAGDWANAALDVGTVAVPGGALVGGLARMGGRALAKKAIEKGAGSLAARAAETSAGKAAVRGAAGKGILGQGEKAGAGRIGKQVGLAQSKRTAGRNAIVLGLANEADNLYGAMRGRTTPTGDPIKGGPKSNGAAGGAAAAGGLSADWALIDSGGGVIAQGGQAIDKAMAGYTNQGGAPAGTQVVYLGGN